MLPKLRSVLNQTLANAAVVFGYLVGTSGVFVFGFQVLQWLRHGEWRPINLVTALAWCGIDWASDPKDWTLLSIELA